LAGAVVIPAGTALAAIAALPAGIAGARGVVPAWLRSLSGLRHGVATAPAARLVLEAAAKSALLGARSLRCLRHRTRLATALKSAARIASTRIASTMPTAAAIVATAMFAALLGIGRHWNRGGEGGNGQGRAYRGFPFAAGGHGRLPSVQC
jgi:hypothetical protein